MASETRMPSSFHHEADGIDRVVRNREALDAHVADVEDGTGLELLDLRRGAFLPFAPVDGGRGELGEIDGNLQRAGKHGKAGDMVAVLVGNDDGAERFRRDADGLEAGKSLALAEAGINENPRVFATDVGAIAGTRCGEDTNANDRR